MTISMLIGHFDIIALIALVLITIVLWKKQYALGCWIPALLFGIALPMASMHFEIKHVSAETEVMDNFTLLYTYFKFPFYWLLGAVLIAILKRKLADSTIDGAA